MTCVHSCHCVNLHVVLIHSSPKVIQLESERNMSGGKGDSTSMSIEGCNMSMRREREKGDKRSERKRKMHCKMGDGMRKHCLIT